MRKHKKLQIVYKFIDIFTERQSIYKISYIRNCDNMYTTLSTHNNEPKMSYISFSRDVLKSF